MLEQFLEGLFLLLGGDSVEHGGHLQVGRLVQTRDTDVLGLAEAEVFFGEGERHRF